MKSRQSWCFVLAAIIAAGILSRTLHSGFFLVDKYLGDALYAAMVYVILRLLWSINRQRLALAAMLLMTAIELFQLTLIPARLAQNSHWIVRMGTRLMGTEFSWADLAAYAVGIACAFLADTPRAAKDVRNSPKE